MGTMCPVELYVIGWPSNGSVSVHSPSSASHRTLYAISTPNMMRNSEPTTVYSIYKKKYRWFAKPTQLFNQAKEIEIENWNFLLGNSIGSEQWIVNSTLTTVMIHFQDTFVTYRAMMCTRGFGCQTLFTYANCFVQFLLQDEMENRMKNESESQRNS